MHGEAGQCDCPSHELRVQKGSQLTYHFIAEDWSIWSVGGPQLIKSCGQKKYCCQPSGNRTSCCDKKEFFDLDEARVLTVIPQHPELASTSKSSTQSSSSTKLSSSTSSTSSISSTPTTAAASTLSAPASPTASPLAANSKSNDSTNKGLAAGLGLVLGLAFVGALLFGLYRWDQQRQAKKQAQLLKRSPAPNDISLPTPLVETEGNMQWEMATPGNTHEAPSQPQTQRTPRTQSGF
ncbi:MAG: hypothetical protein Q9182_002139 [Xanthomendoza sp. 2 TL-2023]